MGSMGVRKQSTRLSLAEVRGLKRIFVQLSAINGMLQRTSWQGAPAALANIELIIAELAPIYNRREAWLPQNEWLSGPGAPPEPPQAAIADQGASLEKSAAPEAHEDE